MNKSLPDAATEEFFAIADVQILDKFTRMFRDEIYAPLNVKYYDELLFRSPDDDRGRLVSQTKLLVLEDILKQLGNTRKRLLRDAKIVDGRLKGS